jgi:antagonist of KipI
MTIRVRWAGLSTTVQAGPRLGLRRFGVSSGGALDTVALRVLNLLVANDAESALLELTSGSVRLQFDDARLIAWSGGDYAVRLGETAIPAGHVASIGAGDELSITGPKEGFRAWLAISGGIEVPSVLGSRSTDLRAQFGGWSGRRLQDGDVIPLGKSSSPAEALAAALESTRISNWSAPFDWTHPSARPSLLHFCRGKDWESFDQASLTSFIGGALSVGTESDRMGVRLRGSLIKREPAEDSFSEAVTPGTIQVPPSGEPILLLGDCQTVGGYLKLAHVISSDLPRAAQLRPGDKVMFQEVSLADAYARLGQIDWELEKFRIGMRLKHR